MNKYKKVLFYILIFIGLSCLFAELNENFKKAKFFYGTFNQHDFFTKDEFRDTLNLPSGGTSIGAHFNIYYGYTLESNYHGGTIVGYMNTINKNRTKKGDIKVWYFKIKGVEGLVLRDSESPPKPYQSKFITYIFFWILSIYAIYKLLKNKFYEK